MPEPEIVISLRGGVVQEVYTSGPLAYLVVVDWDVAPGDSSTTAVLHDGTIQNARVLHPIVEPLHRLAGTEIEAVIEAAEQLAMLDIEP
jgi:hypothetical protein